MRHGGRQKGTPNRNKSRLIRILKEEFGPTFEPVVRMAENAVKMQDLVDADDTVDHRRVAVDAWDKVAQYVEPKLKAVEVTHDIGDFDRTAATGRLAELIQRGIERSSETSGAPELH